MIAICFQSESTLPITLNIATIKQVCDEIMKLASQMKADFRI